MYNKHYNFITLCIGLPVCTKISDKLPNAYGLSGLSKYVVKEFSSSQSSQGGWQLDENGLRSCSVACCWSVLGPTVD